EQRGGDGEDLDTEARLFHVSSSRLQGVATEIHDVDAVDRFRVRESHEPDNAGKSMTWKGRNAHCFDMYSPGDSRPLLVSFCGESDRGAILHDARGRQNVAGWDG